LVDNLGGDLSQVPVDHAHDDRLGLISTQCFTRAFRDGGTGRVRLEASVVATLAAASSGIDRRVPDLSGDVGRSVIEFALEDYSAADSGPERHANHVAPTDGCAAP